jgi:type VI secretion system FHA domain protein
VDLAGILRAAGVDPATLDPAAIASLGEVLHVVVDGLMGALKARAEIKNQFRVAMTTLKPLDNNPLKFSVDANDALRNLFGRRNQSFQSPVDAFREAFEDIKAHQLAMTAGMRAAFTELMSRFDPEELQESFDRGLKRSSLLDIINKTKYWDLYREMYASLGDDDASFRHLFGDEFAQAYEEQMQRLAASRNKR